MCVATYCAVLPLISMCAFGRLAAQTTASPASLHLLDTIPAAGRIVAERHYPSVGVTQWTLSNGATVLLKPTTSTSKEIFLRGMSSGGISLFRDTDFPTALYVNQIMSVCGFGRFSQTTLDNQLSQTSARLSTSIQELDEKLTGSAEPQDLETLFQLLVLKMTAPRYDSSAVALGFKQERYTLAARAAQSGTRLEDSIHVVLASHSPRVPILTPGVLDHVDPERAVALYKDRFADASGFTFLLVGNFTPDSLKPLVERYLASLPALHRHEYAKDLSYNHSPAGVIKQRFVTRDLSGAELWFIGSVPDSTRATAALNILAHVLQQRLRNRLEEQLGDAYNVHVGLDVKPPPVGQYALSLIFTSDATRREEIMRAAFAVIDTLQQIGPTADELRQFTEPTLQQAALDRRTDYFWLPLLELSVRGHSLDALLEDSPLQTLTPAEVQQAARRYLNQHHYMEFDLVPASTAGSEPAAAGSR